MELRSYAINEKELYAVNLKLHVTEISALHFDNAKLFEAHLIEKIKEATSEIADHVYAERMKDYDRIKAEAQE